MYEYMITEDEYFERINKISLKVKEKGLDAVLIVSCESEPANVRYLSNYTPIFETAGIIINKDGEAILLIGPESERLAEEHSVVKRIKKLIEFRESSDPDYPDIKHDSFKEIFKEMKISKRLGLIGTNIMTVQAYEGILSAAKRIDIVKSDEILRDLRMFKSRKEIELLKKAASIAEEGFKYAIERIKPGMTEIQATAECIYGIFSKGAEDTGFKVWILSGEGANQAIGKYRYKIIKESEIVQINMGASVNGYVSSFGRPVVYGKLPTDIKKIIRIGLKANELTYSLMKPRAEASDIAKKVHSYIREIGYSDYIVYGPAHGIGMMECEYPFIETTSDYKLKKNMTFAVDTFLGGARYGLRFEDTALVTNNGIERFTNYGRKIINL